MPAQIHTALTLILAAALVTACSKRAPSTTSAPPTPEVSLPTEAPAPAVPGPPPPAPAPVPGVEAPQPQPPAAATPAEDRPPSPAQLQAAYLAAKETADRIEIVFQLSAADTADAMAVLMRLFQAEADVHMKQEMLDAADRIDGQLPAMLTLLNVALGPAQPADVRDSALTMLLGINDRRAIPNWQALLADPDPDTRELARQQIEELQQLPLEPR